MSNFRTPDVYTEEIPLLPQSVAQVSTAIPAFIGYTEKANIEGNSVTGTAVRVSTLLEYTEIFGGAPNTEFTVNMVEEGAENIASIEVNAPQSILYHSLDHYFKNGGGDCYIISVGTYDDTYGKQAFLDGLDILAKEDEPTLIMLGEAAKLDAADYYEVCQAALNQCADLKDRFCIFDIKRDDIKAEGFRNGVGNHLKYGAAYTPYLQTTLNYQYTDTAVTIKGLPNEQRMAFVYLDAIKITYEGPAKDSPKFKINKTAEGEPVNFKIEENELTIENVGDSTKAAVIVEEWAGFAGDGKFNIELIDGEKDVVPTTLKALNDESVQEHTLANIKKTKSALHSKIVSELAKKRMILPPSAAVAGAYCATDRERGVWKAPANINLNAVVGPIRKISSSEQEQLNIDDNAGKSVNAIRSFSGKGTLVWGARTLDGNDQEWRYVSVRRLFNMIEESTKKASYFAVFEPNTPATWLKVKAMIDSFLYGIWQQGGLAGTTEDQAYFVNVGLGKTMTSQDVLDGKMVVEIGVAAVRPAEFIVLKFSHKLQEA